MNEWGRKGKDRSTKKKYFNGLLTAKGLRERRTCGETVHILWEVKKEMNK